MSKLDKDQVIEKFTKAYQAANGKAPEIEAKGGWYSVDGGKNMRLAQLDEMADELAGGSTAAKDEKPAAKKTADKKPAAKKAAKPKASKKAKSNFSVKEYWAQQLAEKGQQGRLPR